MSTHTPVDAALPSSLTLPDDGTSPLVVESVNTNTAHLANAIVHERAQAIIREAAPSVELSFTGATYTAGNNIGLSIVTDRIPGTGYSIVSSNQLAVPSSGWYLILVSANVFLTLPSGSANPRIGTIDINKYDPTLGSTTLLRIAKGFRWLDSDGFVSVDGFAIARIGVGESNRLRFSISASSSYEHLMTPSSVEPSAWVIYLGGL